MRPSLRLNQGRWNGWHLRVVECRVRFTIRSLAEIMSLAISARENVYAAITIARVDPPIRIRKYMSSMNTHMSTRSSATAFPRSKA